MSGPFSADERKLMNAMHDCVEGDLLDTMGGARMLGAPPIDFDTRARLMISWLEGEVGGAEKYQSTVASLSTRFPDAAAIASMDPDKDEDYMETMITIVYQIGFHTCRIENRKPDL